MTTTAGDMPPAAAMDAPAAPSAAADTPPWSAAARALVTPCERRLWRPLWLLLLIGLALRLLAAYHGHWHWRIDEVFQYLEQAHRVVFGYGYIPWEYRYGARSWLTPAMAMPPLYLAKFLGLDNPAAYATLVNSWNALLSLTIPLCSYIVARRLLPERAARWTLVFTCLWYEFIIIAPRTLAEIYAAQLFIAALAMGAGGGRGRWLVAGFLMGAALAYRPHYAPLAAIVGVLWLWLLPWRLSRTAIAGGVAALLLWGIVDWLTHGILWGSVVNYLEYVPALFDHYAESETHTFWRLMLYLMQASFGLYALFAAAALADMRRLWLPLLLVAAPLALYSLHYNQQYSNVFVFLPLLWMLAGGLLVKFSQASALAGRAMLAAIVAVGAVGIAGKLPYAQGLFSTTAFFSPAPLWQMVGRARDLLKDEKDVVLVIVSDAPMLRHGGFYTLHLNIPVLHLSQNRINDLGHDRIWAAHQAQGLESIATHVIDDADLNNPAFDRIPLADDVYLYVNKQAPTADITGEWVYDYLNPGLDTEEKLPPRELTRYNPDL